MVAEVVSSVVQSVLQKSDSNEFLKCAYMCVTQKERVHIGIFAGRHVEVALEYALCDRTPAIVFERILRIAFASKHALVGAQMSLLVPSSGTPAVPGSAESGSTHSWRYKFRQQLYVRQTTACLPRKRVVFAGGAFRRGVFHGVLKFPAGHFLAASVCGVGRPVCE